MMSHGQFGPRRTSRYARGVTEPPFLRATRAAYDTVAVDYARLLAAEVPETPLDFAMLEAFAKLVAPGRVADIGCGPGRMTAHLSSLGVPAFGVDLSPEMVATARETYPDLHFGVGSMTALSLADSSVEGVLAWYSIIHIPPPLLPAVLAEFHRVLTAGGHLLVAFQVGDERRHIEHGYGHDISLDVYRLSPDAVADLLDRAGLPVRARMVREPEGHEKVPQACLLARKP
jgi:SAM-dependent methyltransferase